MVYNDSINTVTERINGNEQTGGDRDEPERESRSTEKERGKFPENRIRKQPYGNHRIYRTFGMG